jgi:hypothetical protein
MLLLTLAELEPGLALPGVTDSLPHLGPSSLRASLII